MNETHTVLSSGELVWYVCKRAGLDCRLDSVQSIWLGRKSRMGCDLLGRMAGARLQEGLMCCDPCLGKKQRPCKVSSPVARVRNTIQFFFSLLKWGPLLLNMEKHEKCGPESLCPGSFCGWPLTFHGVHDVALLEVCQFGFLHHHCRTKHFSEASWDAGRCLHLTPLKFNIVSPPAPIQHLRKTWPPRTAACGILVSWNRDWTQAPGSESAES